MNAHRVIEQLINNQKSHIKSDILFTILYTLLLFVTLTQAIVNPFILTISICAINIFMFGYTVYTFSKDISTLKTLRLHAKDLL